MGKKEEGAVGMNEDIEPTAKPITWRVVWSHRTPSQVQQSLSSFQEVVFGKELSHVWILDLYPIESAGVSRGGEASLSREREWLKWSKAEQGAIEDKEEEKEDGVEWKRKESRHKTWYCQLKRPILILKDWKYISDFFGWIKIYLMLRGRDGMGWDEYL